MSASLSHIGLRACSSFETVKASYAMAKNCIEEGIPGDFVECGVFAGAQAAAMARAIVDCGVYDRQIHLFDSFEGIPKAGEFDNDLRPLVGSGSCSVGDVSDHMREWGLSGGLFQYHKGWFEDTVPRYSGQIAILRLDGDLYESTKVCLQHLYPKLVTGGWCIVDDWNLDGCRKAVEEVVGYVAPVYWRAL